ncbi:MAG: heme A synthase [Deltaproteobacteria bacterium]|nr:heme A synthase [Deltaproteobacteria bacterium]
MNTWLNRIAILTAVLTWILVVVGALVTSTGSGLSVPDWPLSFGQFFPPMVGGVLFEHGHRMIAGVVGLLAIVQAIFAFLVEKRGWVKALFASCVALVIVQAVFGGLTVLHQLPVALSVVHACLGQLFFCLAIIAAAVTLPAWNKQYEPLSDSGWLSTRTLCILLFSSLFVQLLLGAYMRHLNAGLAIPDFPLSFGSIVPPFLSEKIAVNFAHRAWALPASALVVWVMSRIYIQFSNRLGLVGLAGVLAWLVVLQLMLGALIIWLGRPVGIASAHVAVGALVLGCVCLLTVIIFRLHSNKTAFPRA